MREIVLVSLKCGRFDKRINVVGNSEEEVEVIKKGLVYDKSKFILIVI